MYAQNINIAKHCSEHYINVHASSELAVIGSGDVLSGLLVSLIGDKKMNPFLAGCAATWLHGDIAKNYNVNLDCITISQKQYDFAKERIFKCGLNEKVNIEIKDYRDLKNKYDSIVSIEMIEAVGQNYLQSYFNIITEFS